MSISTRARPEIQALRPYEAAAQVTDTIRLNANEAPWSSGADRFRRPLNRYPEVRPMRLKAALADRFGCRTPNLLVTRSFCSAATDNIVTMQPTFSMYAHYAVIQGVALRDVALDPDKDFRFEPDAVLAACDDATKLVFVCSPNNPTGSMVSRESIVRLLDALRSRCRRRRRGLH